MAHLTAKIVYGTLMNEPIFKPIPKGGKKCITADT